jgi:hypothetical protein
MMTSCQSSNRDNRRTKGFASSEFMTGIARWALFNPASSCRHRASCHGSMFIGPAS